MDTISVCALTKQESPLRKRRTIELGHLTNTQHRDMVKKSCKMRNCMPDAKSIC